jgi:hypothetical protein
MLVLATITAPAPRSRRTINASTVAGVPSSASIREPARDFTRYVEQVFDAYNCTVARSERDSELGACIGGICLGTRGLSVDSKTGEAAFAGWISDPGECLLKSVSGSALRHSRTISQATAMPANRLARL